jgi:FkbM family methyltransferase
MKTAPGKIINLLTSRKAVPLTFVDIGAKGTLQYIKGLEGYTELHAFEPNPGEFNKLKSKYHAEAFSSLNLNELALSEKDSTMMLNVTENSSMSSLLEPDLHNYEKHFGDYRDFEKWKKGMNVRQKIEVRTRTLDNYFSTLEKTIDYLKIDTQGTELSILKGALNLLKNGSISIISIEVTLVPVYKNQVLFADIDIFLRAHNYYLVDLRTYPDENVIQAASKRSHFAPCGDAIYILYKETNNISDSIKCGLILSWLGYSSLAINILKSAKVDTGDIKTILSNDNQDLNEIITSGVKAILPPSLLNAFKKYLR